MTNLWDETIDILKEHDKTFHGTVETLASVTNPEPLLKQKKLARWVK